MSNTNSCASCHLTHTAQGEKLLFANSIWSTCTSCHDGTMGILNVFKIEEDRGMVDSNGQITDSYAFGGGTFAGPFGYGSSMHMATGIMQVSAAPGGFQITPENELDPLLGINMDPSKGSAWGSPFSCVSCHSPHGSYSDRLLHYNPNGVGNEDPELGGFKRVNITVSEVEYNDETRYVVAKDDSLVDNFGDRDKNPWLYGYSYDETKEYWTRIYAFDATGEVINPPSGDTWNDYVSINYEEAYFTIPEGTVDALGNPLVNANFKMDIASAVVVKMTLGEKTEDGISEILNYGDEKPINAFCSACHTDYIYPAGGVFAEMASHRVDINVNMNLPKGKNGQATCLTCHFAHGTTAAIMMDANNT